MAQVRMFLLQVFIIIISLVDWQVCSACFYLGYHAIIACSFVPAEEATLGVVDKSIEFLI
jgi:hypothetical protein